MKTAAFPLARITFFFVAGILVSHYRDTAPKEVLLILLAFSLLLLAFWILALHKRAMNLFFGVLVSGYAAILGMTTQTLHNEQFQPNHYIHHCADAEQTHQYVATLREKLKSTATNERYIADVLELDGKKSSGKILLNIRRHNSFLPLMIGSRLKIKSKIHKHGATFNPDQFDYGQYLSRKSIFAQSYPDGNSLQICSKPDPTIWYFAAKFRQRIIRNLAEKQFKKDELHVVTALLLGSNRIFLKAF